MQEIRGGRCMATLIIVGSVLFSLSLNGTFLFLSVILLKCKISEPGVLWLLSSSLLGIVSFVACIQYALLSYSFSARVEKRRLRVKGYCVLLLVIQYVLLLVGTIFYAKWSKGDVRGLRPCCLLYMVLGWVFESLFLVLFITCDILFTYQISSLKQSDQRTALQTPTENATCCCNDPENGDCCRTCDECCFGIPVTSSRARYNNSCCCDGCCGCCIDCCIECCGESSRPLPPGTTNRDIVYLGRDHRVVYMPTIESIPMAEVVPTSIAPIEVIPFQTPSYAPVPTPMYYPPMSTSYTAPLMQEQPVPISSARVETNHSMYPNAVKPVVV